MVGTRCNSQTPQKDPEHSTIENKKEHMSSVAWWSQLHIHLYYSPAAQNLLYELFTHLHFHTFHFMICAFSTCAHSHYHSPTLEAGGKPSTWWPPGKLVEHNPQPNANVKSHWRCTKSKSKLAKQTSERIQQDDICDTTTKHLSTIKALQLEPLFQHETSCNINRLQETWRAT